MPINMTDYKMIIHERVYNVIQIMIDFAPYEENEEGKPPKPKFIEAVYIDKDTRIRDFKRDLMLGEVFYR